MYHANSVAVDFNNVTAQWPLGHWRVGSDNNVSFCFSFLVTFGEEVTKIWKYYVIFVYILQGKMGKTEKKERKSRS